MKFEFNEDAESVYTEEFHYDLFYGGYIKPEKLLSNESQINELNAAIELINDFETQLEQSGLLEEM